VVDFQITDPRGRLMGKRSNFERREADFYPTPRAAVVPLSAGDGALVGHMEPFGLGCVYAGDARTGQGNHDERHTLRDQAGNEGDVTAQALKLCERDLGLRHLCSLQRGLEIGSAIECIAPLGRLHLGELGHNREPTATRSNCVEENRTRL
jgi:hypothetical protein